MITTKSTDGQNAGFITAKKIKRHTFGWEMSFSLARNAYKGAQNEN